MTPDDLTLREGWDFEAKLALGRDGRGSVPASLWETYAAMANTLGGRILLGARELPDGSLEPVGIPDIDKLETDLWNQLNDRTKVSVNLLTRAMVSRVDIGGLTLLQIDVPKADRAHLPVHLNGSFQHNTFVRIADGDRRAGPDTVRRLVADSDPLRDSRILSEYTLDDLDPATLRHFREVFLARRRGHPFAAVDGVEFLTQIRVWARDRSSGTEGPTRAGLLMFGRELAIRELYPHWHLSYQERSPLVERWADRVAPDGTWEANVYNFYLRVYSKLVAGVKVPFALDGVYRVDETDVHRALREAFINTLVHADYAGPGGVRVIREHGAYVFKDPGLPLVAAEQLWHGGISVSRNPTMLHLFALVELGEREGSGGPAIRNAWRAQHWQSPALRLDLANVETHLVLSQESLLPEGSVAELTEQWGTRFTALDEVGRVAMVTAHAEDGVSHARLRELLDAHPRDITLRLQDLVRRGMLEALGKGTGRSYRARVGETGERPSPATAGPSPAIAGSSPAIAGSSPATASSSVARFASAGRARPQDARRAVLEVCRDAFRTVAEIGDRLNRGPRAVRVHVAGLLADGALELLHPDTPSHPKQAYRARPPEPTA